MIARAIVWTMLGLALALALLCGCATVPVRPDSPCRHVRGSDGCDVYRCGESEWDPSDGTWNARYLYACTPEAIERARREAEEQRL